MLVLGLRSVIKLGHKMDRASLSVAKPLLNENFRVSVSTPLLTLDGSEHFAYTPHHFKF
jgi:hypothetical protein